VEKKLAKVFCGKSQKFEIKKSQKFYVGLVTEVSRVTHLRQNTFSMNFSNFEIICQARKSAETRKNDVIFLLFLMKNV
jgi:hypothetical protein